MGNENNQQAKGSTENKSVVSDILEDVLSDQALEEGQSEDAEEFVQDTDESGAQTNQNDEDEGRKAQDTDSGKQANQSVITQEMAQLAGLPKEMIGKPLMELVFSHKNLLQEYSRLTQSNKAQQKDKNSQQDEAKEYSPDEEPPDAVTDPSGYSSLMKYLIGEVQRLRSQVGNLPHITETIERQQAESVVNLSVQKLQSILPKDVDAKAVMQDWYKANQHLIPAYESAGVFKNNPDLFISNVVQHWKAKQFDSKSKQQTQADIKSKHASAVNQQRQIARQNNNTSFASSQRSDTQKKSIMSEILEDITADESLK